MRPLSLITGGLVVVVLDFRTESLDLLPDPVGWVMVAVGSWRLSLVSASWLAGVTAALSVSGVALPYRYVHIDPLTGDRLCWRVRPPRIGRGQRGRGACHRGTSSGCGTRPETTRRLGLIRPAEVGAQRSSARPGRRLLV